MRVQNSIKSNIDLGMMQNFRISISVDIKFLVSLRAMCLKR